MAAPGVIFDVDGTLLDTNYLHVLAWWRAFRDVGETRPMSELHACIGLGSGLLVERLRGEQPDNAAINDGHSSHYAQLREEVVPFAGAPELVRRCADAGLTVVLATSGAAEDLDWMLPAIGVAKEQFGAVLTSEDVSTAKPAPDIMLAAVEAADLDLARTAEVGDTVWDAQSARAAGVAFVGLTVGGIDEPALRAEGAREVWRHPTQLLERFDHSLLSSLGS